VRHCGLSVEGSAGVRQMDRAVLDVRLTEHFINGREIRLRFRNPAALLYVWPKCDITKSKCGRRRISVQQVSE